RADEGRVVDPLRLDPSAHASRHEELRRRIDHSVLLGNEVPGGLRLPGGSEAFSWMHPTAIGRCVAARSASLSGDGCCANAVPKPTCGIQMKPCASDARCGAWGCGFPR